MHQTLVGTSALVAFFVASEHHHSKIERYVLGNLSLQWIILSTVFDETVTWLRVKVSVEASIAVAYYVKSISMSP